MLQTFPAKPIDFLTTFWTHHGPHSLSYHAILLDAKPTIPVTKNIVRCLAPYEDPPQSHFSEN
ncbi:hypothetical protein Nmel_008272 [Mimus melanotis]